MKKYDRMSLRKLMESFLFEEDGDTGEEGREGEGSESEPGVSYID